MPRNHGATDRRVPLNFRHWESRKLMLESFRVSDGESELTPILRKAVDFYTSERIRLGRDPFAQEAA